MALATGIPCPLTPDSLTPDPCFADHYPPSAHTIHRRQTPHPAPWDSEKTMRTVRNITVSVNPEIDRQAKLYAARHDVTVSADLTPLHDMGEKKILTVKLWNLYKLFIAKELQTKIQPSTAAVRL
jgi:hypothetical protein